MRETKKTDMGQSAEQLPLAFSHEAQTSRDDLRVGDPVEAAVAMIDRWPDWPSPVIVLAGPPGSGKSHLAEIWREQSGAQNIHPLADSEASLVAAHGPVLFEDADRVAFDDNALFHTINAVRQHGQTLLMTARSWPTLWPVELPDLSSRLKAATIVEIGEPDDELLAQVLVKLFADRQIIADDKLVSYIAARMERSNAAAVEIVERLDSLALARGAKISRALAGEVLAAMEDAGGL
jgi:chromosomal replication initiation ATPase DnaA